MKKIAILFFGLVILLTGCQREIDPSVSGTFSGPITIIKSGIGGLTHVSGQEITVRQVNDNTVELSGLNFETFQIRELIRNNDNWSRVNGSEFFYFNGQASDRSLQLDWTTTFPDGRRQTVKFGGTKKRKR